MHTVEYAWQLEAADLMSMLTQAGLKQAKKTQDDRPDGLRNMVWNGPNQPISQIIIQDHSCQ